jgi:hypothetical protein
MMRNTKQKKISRPKKSVRNLIIVKHIKGIKRALLEGEKRPAFLEFLKQSNHRNGLYALYDKEGNLYYIGKATDLKSRLDTHLRDKHSASWDQMTLFFLSKKANVAELEGLLVAAAKPPGNTQKPKIGTDLRKSLQKFLTEDAKIQIDDAIYPDRALKSDSLSSHITARRLKMLSKLSLSKALKITISKLNRLLEEDPTNLKAVRRYIRESGKRDAVLLLIDKLKA